MHTCNTINTVRNLTLFSSLDEHTKPYCDKKQNSFCEVQSFTKKTFTKNKCTKSHIFKLQYVNAGLGQPCNTSNSTHRNQFCVLLVDKQSDNAVQQLSFSKLPLFYLQDTISIQFQSIIAIRALFATCWNLVAQYQQSMLIFNVTSCCC